jgi:hypothetical protein
LGSPIPVAISDNKIAFIIVTTNKKQQKEIRKLLDEFTRSHLEFYD